METSLIRDTESLDNSQVLTLTNMLVLAIPKIQQTISACIEEGITPRTFT